MVLRNDARNLFREGLDAADPYTAVVNALKAGSDIDGKFENTTYRSLRCSSSRIRIVAFGKAAIPMTEGALHSISEDQLSAPPLVVTNYQNSFKHPKMQIFWAGHPVPTEDGLIAAKAISSAVRDTKDDESILALISGGASALLPMPSPTISLEDKRRVTQLLLMSGADIHETNAVRKHISNLKGGGLARLASPTSLTALILSDVLDNDLGTIASGVTAGDTTTFSDAVYVLHQRGIWDQIPSPVRVHLESGCAGLINETPFPNDAIFNNTFNIIIGSNRTSLSAVCKTGKLAGYDIKIVSEMLTGEAKLVAKEFCKRITMPVDRPTAYIAGGETTVTVKGSGRGGRNQELALAFALASQSSCSQNSWVFLSGSTDGIDGPTDAAGGIVDEGTLPRIFSAGFEPMELLTNNDSYHALHLADDLLFTGTTGTNVADLQILLISPT